MAIIFSFCFLFPTLTVGKTEDKKSATSYVAEMKKKETPVKKKAESSYINSRKNSGADSEDSYVAERKKKNNPAPKNEKLSYINSMKNRETKSENSFVRSHQSQLSTSSYIKRMKEGKYLVVTLVKGDINKTNQVTIISRPVKKVREKIFFPDRSPVNFQTDLSFDPADYKVVDQWAKQQGKAGLIEQVLKKYGDEIKALASEFKVDFRIIVAICTHESGGNPSVISSAGACCLMQLMPGTAANYGLDSVTVWDPYQNLRAGTHYFSDMLKLFGNVKDAIYAYGWGQGAAKTGLDAGIKADELRGVQEVLYLASTVKKSKK